MALRAPARALQPFVSHYWLYRRNADDAFDILPDGAVDAVIEMSGTRCRCLVFGTTTGRRRFPLRRGSDYLGIRFRPGRATRLLTVSAAELTDGWASAADVLAFPLDEIAERAATDGVFASIDGVLERQFLLRGGAPSRIGEVVEAIETSNGALRMSQAAEVFGRGSRQLQRAFLHAVGVTPKVFARIVRFRHARALIGARRHRLADIAAASGYADQSHMNNEFRALGGVSPLACARGDVAFLQDPS